MTPLALGALCVAALVVSGGAQPLVMAWATNRRVLATPNERSLHQRATPVGGGAPMALLLVTTCAGLGLWGLVDDVPWLAFAVCLTAVTAVSFIDDLAALSPTARLLVHLSAAAWLAHAVAGGGSPGEIAATAAGALWLVGVTNACNFMDGIDGIAGTQALVAGLAWVWLGTVTGHVLPAALGTVLAGAAVGFLAFNWQPARIFMGDVGAAPLGFTLAALVLLAWTDGWRPAAAGVLVLWPFLFDTALTLLRRLARGENVVRAHRSHLYQRLVQAGWSHQRVSALYGVLALAGWALGWVVMTNVPSAAAGAAAGVTVLAFGLWWSVRKAEAQ